MNPLRLLGLLLLLITTSAVAQNPTPSPTPPLLKPDDRLKVDVLLIVAHPDDETGVVPYLVQLIDQKKHVAVVYTTHGRTQQHGAGAGAVTGRGARNGAAACAGERGNR